MKARVVIILPMVILTLFLLSSCGEALVNKSTFYPLPGSTLDITALPDSIEQYFFDSSDGVKLSAFYLSNPEANKTIIYFHGNFGNASIRLPLAAELAKLESNIFLVDYRGYGLSSGEPSEEGVYSDAQAALTFVGKQWNLKSQEIFLFGRSLGSAVAIDLATRYDFAGIILVTPLSSGKDVARNAGMSYLAPFIGDPFNNKRKIAELNIPILIIHGDSDEVLPLEMGLALEKSAKTPTRMAIIPGAGHNNISNDYKTIFYGHVKSFYDDVFERLDDTLGINSSAGETLNKNIGFSRTSYMPSTQQAGEWVVRSEEDWKKITQNENIYGADQHNFDEDMLIGVTMGMFNTGGYSVRIDSVIRSNEKMSIHYTSKYPYPGQLVTEAFTWPQHWVVLPKDSVDIVFIRN